MKRSAWATLAGFACAAVVLLGVAATPMFDTLLKDTLTVDESGKVNVLGTFQIRSVTVTATAAELNAVGGLETSYATTSGRVVAIDAAYAITSNNFGTVSNNYATSSGVLSRVAAAYAITSNNYATSSGTLSTVAAAYAVTSNNYASTSGTVSAVAAAFAVVSNNFGTVSNNYATTSNAVGVLAAAYAVTSNNYATTSNALGTLSTAFGIVSNNYAVTSNTAANAATKSSVLGSIAMSRAFNNATNGVVTMQAKTLANANPAQSYLATIWVSKTALGTPDKSDFDVISSITCGTVITNLCGTNQSAVMTDGDGKIAWAFETSNTNCTNYFYCDIGAVPIGVLQVVTPGSP